MKNHSSLGVQLIFSSTKTLFRGIQPVYLWVIVYILHHHSDYFEFDENIWLQRSILCTRKKMILIWWKRLTVKCTINCKKGCVLMLYFPIDMIFLLLSIEHYLKSNFLQSKNLFKSKNDLFVRNLETILWNQLYFKAIFDLK